MFHLDPADPTPLETQLARTIRSAIAAGVLEPGDALPTVRQLAVELRVNANAVERALAGLQRDGVLRREEGELRVATSAGALGRQALLDELVALEDSFLRQAAELGFSLDDVIIHLHNRRTP